MENSKSNNNDTNNNNEASAAKTTSPIAANDNNNEQRGNPNGSDSSVQINGNGELDDSNTCSNEGGATRRTRFTELSQVEADLALARTLQEQERAYMMLSMNDEGIDYGSWDAGSYGHDEDDDEDFDDPSEEEDDGSNVDEDAFDVHAHDEASEDENQGVELDPSAFSSDEAYARALQDTEEREVAARLLALAGINEMYVRQPQDEEDRGINSQDAWEDVDPDELSYEELIALGEVVGTESRGLSADTVASLPSVNYKTQTASEGTTDSCVICRSDYEDGQKLTVLSCKHTYHSECLNKWLQINKVCPICSTEVSTSGNS
ncbi:E3 ubiquitin ligase BIG BROTHER-related [Lycium ferocissimum]|uniref:E3 ubiquitin ligase BIG BROTHER-related n=1 Tax=Lycium ferocissimum TaxID=112874 RepID=UPI0028149AAB|nr:E3 ubiquitin ligase BIG BROTHER-related [Lycium ferocissimum]